MCLTIYLIHNSGETKQTSEIYYTLAQAELITFTVDPNAYNIVHIVFFKLCTLYYYIELCAVIEFIIVRTNNKTLHFI